jgi:hypothetical protein
VSRLQLRDKLLTLAAMISLAVCRCCGCLGFGVDGVTVLVVAMVAYAGRGWCFARANRARGDVGCGDVFQPIAEKFHGDIP